MNDLEDLMKIEQIKIHCKNQKVNLSNNYIETILNIGKVSVKLKDPIIDNTVPNYSSRNTIDALYTSLSSETLCKLKKNTVKSTYKNTLWLYRDLDSEDFRLCQSERTNYLNNSIASLRMSKAIRPRMIEKLFEGNQIKKSTYVIGKISSLITLFFTKANKDTLLKEFSELIQELKEKNEERQVLKVNIFKSLEKNFDLLLLLVNSIESKEDRLEYLIEMMKCLPLIESRLVLFNLMKEFSKGEALMKEYDDTSPCFFDITKLFNFNCKNSKLKKEDDIKKEGESEIQISPLEKEMNSIFNSSTNDNKIIKIANTLSHVYYLVNCGIKRQSSNAPSESNPESSNQTVERHLVMISKRIEDNKIERIKPIDIIPQENDLSKINFLIKDDSFIWMISFKEKTITFIILDLVTLQVFKIETIEVDEVICQIYNDTKRLYCILSESKRLFSCKINLQFSDKKYFSLKIVQEYHYDSIQTKSEEKEKEKEKHEEVDYTSLNMKDSISINDIILMENKDGSKVYSKFVLNKKNSIAVHYILYTNTKTNPNKLYSYYQKENIMIKFSCTKAIIKQISSERHFIALPYSYHCGNLIKTNKAYETLIYSFAKHIAMSGNFDRIIINSIGNYHLTQHPLVFVEYDEFIFILNQLLNCDLSSPLMSSYFIIIKQYSNTLFNMNRESVISSNKDIEKHITLLKEFIIKFIKGYSSSTCPHKKLIINQIIEIERNLSIDCFSINELKPLIAQCKTNIEKLSLLQLFIKEQNLSNILLYELVSEIEIDLFNNSFNEYEQHYDFINSTLKSVIDCFIKCNFDSKVIEYLTIVYRSIKAIADKCVSADNNTKLLKQHMIKNSFIYKGAFFLIQNLIIKMNTIDALKQNLPLLLNLLINIQHIDSQIAIDASSKDKLRITNYDVSKQTSFIDDNNLVIKSSPNSNIKESSTILKRSVNDKDWMDLFSSTLEEKPEDKLQLDFSKKVAAHQKDLLNYIELSIVYYILSIFQQEELNQNSQMNTNCELDKKLQPFYSSKLLQFISLNNINSKDIINTAINEDQYINVSLLLSSLEIPAKNEIESMFITYQSKESMIENTKKSLSSIDYSLPQVDSAIICLNKALGMKNSILASLGGTKIIPIIVKLFSVIVKYHNLNNKFLAFATEINDTPNESWHSIVNYDIFYSIWASCSQIRIWFSELRSQIPETEIIDDANFDNEIVRQLETIRTKAQFINDIIFPSPYEISTFKEESVAKLIEILKSNEFGIEEIKQRSKEQNAKSAIKTNHLNLINLLLSISSRTSVVNYILYHLNTHFRTEKRKLVSFIDDLLGADYLSIDKVKNQFHLLLDLIKEKITSSAFDSMSNNTKMNLYQSLLWKIKGRDFNIISKLCCLFSQLHKCHFSINNRVNWRIPLSDSKVNHRLFEWFKIVSLQVFKRIKSTHAFQRKDSLSLSRNVSKLTEDDEKQIINYIVAFYCELSDQNDNFNAFLLHLYQCLVNERELTILVINSSPLILVKIIKILRTNCVQTTKAFETNLILIKLLYQLLANVDNTTQVDPDLLKSICIINDNDNNKDKDPYEVIFNYVFELYQIEKNILLRKEYELIIQMFIINEQFSSLCNDKLFSIISNGNMMKLLSLFGIDSYPFRFGRRIIITTNIKPNKLINDSDEKNIKYGYILSFIQDSKDNEAMSYYAKSTKDIVNYSEEKQLELQGLSSIKQINMKNLLLADDDLNDSIKQFILSNNKTILKEAIKAFEASSMKSRDKYLLLKFIYDYLSYSKPDNDQTQMDDLHKVISAMMEDNYNKDFYFTSLEVLENELVYQLERPEVNSSSCIREEPQTISDLFTYTIDIKSKSLKMENQLSNLEFKGEFNNIMDSIKHNITSNTISFYDCNNKKVVWNDSYSNDKDNHFIFVEKITEDFVKCLNSNGHISKCKCVITNTCALSSDISFPVIMLPEEPYSQITSALLSLHTASDQLKKMLLYHYCCFADDEEDTNQSQQQQQQEDTKEKETVNNEEEDNLGSFFTILDQPKKTKLIYDIEHQRKMLKKALAIKEHCFQRMIVLISRRILLKNISLKHLTYSQYSIYSKDKNILDLFRLLSFEYYFNTSYSNLSNENIRKLLRGFLESLSNDDLSIEIINNFFNSSLYSNINYFNNDFSSFKSYCTLDNQLIESNILKENKETFDMVYSNIMFILNSIPSFDKSNSKAIQCFLSSFFNQVISSSLSSVVVKNESLSVFMLSVMNQIFEEIINDKPNKGIFMEFITKHNLSRLINLIINFLNIEKFLDENLITYSKSQTDLIQFVFKYYDVTFWMFINYNISENVFNWIDNDMLFNQFYYQYHLLSLNKSQEPHELKLSLIQSIYGFKLMDVLKLNSNVIEKASIQQLNYQLKFHECLDIVLSKKEVKVHKENYGKDNSKVIMFTKDQDDDDKNIINIQDIIDGSYNKNHKYYYQSYPNTNISLWYLNTIETQLFAFGSNYSHSLGIGGDIGIDYFTPKECKGLSKSTWNFNYGYYYVIALDDNGTIYSCGVNSGGGLGKRSIKKFSNQNAINNAEDLKNNIADFACGNSNATLLLTKTNKLYGIGKNESKLLSKTIDKKCNVPTLITQPVLQSKIVQISLGFHNSFIITEDGTGYAMGSNTHNQIDETTASEYSSWIKMKLPSDLKGFVSSACGEEFYLFLIETNEETIGLYSSGSNDKKSCGIIEAKPTHFNRCDYSKGLQFKTISCRNSACGAITSSGQLYIWGTGHFQSGGISAIVYPKVIELQKEAIFDDISISETHMIALVREKQENQYVKAVYSIGDNTHGALGLVQKDKLNIGYLNKLTFFSSSRKTPIKITSGYNHSYVLTIDSIKLQSEINSNVIINQKETIPNQVTITISQNNKGLNNQLVSFYQSSTFSEIEEYVNQISHNITQEFYDLLEDIAFSKEIKIDKVTYEMFKEEIASQNKSDLKLGALFNNKTVTEPISKTLFIYLCTKIQLINSIMVKLTNRNRLLVDKTFLNKAIKNNLHFLSSETRIKKFNEFLEVLRKKNKKSKRLYCKVDRFKASEFYEKNMVDFELKETVFGQVYQGFHKTENEYYYLGQLDRLFVVEFLREGATDQGGPYHDVFTAIADEVQSKSLDLFIKSPNNRVNIGAMRDKYVINPDAILESQTKAYEFLGKLFASSIFSGECLNLNIHPSIWRLLFGTKLVFNDLEGIDLLFYKLINDIDKCQCKTNDEFVKQFDIVFSIQNSGGKDVELKDNGAKIKVTLGNKDEFIKLAKQRRLEEFDFQVQYIKKGLNDIINESYLEILFWRELDELICGKPKLDLELLKKKTSYSGYNEKDEIITWFWQTLEEFNEHERVLYLKYVWGRSRLPSCGFSHVVSKIGYCEASNKLPESSTCFCKLLLPKYPTKEILQAKLKYAIVNCNEIDADY